MQVDLVSGLFDKVTYIASPNFDQRPAEISISLIVIHGISLPAGQFGGDEVIQLFTNQLDYRSHLSFEDLKGLRVSSHLFIRRDGTVIQFVPLHCRAWHAGVSNFHGRERCNDFSIGIELEGTDTIPYTDVQYQQLRLIINALQYAYPAITNERIMGHSDIAPGRKTDPGPAFCWEKLL